ncbi:MAG: hypothetical protein ACOX0X_00270 [Candidatus Dojkabacteria bacterium]
MEQRDYQDNHPIFNSNEDILERYEDLFEEIKVGGYEDLSKNINIEKGKDLFGEGGTFYLEKNTFTKDTPNIYRFLITPHGLIALSTSTAEKRSREKIWNLDPLISEVQEYTMEDFLMSLDSFVETRLSRRIKNSDQNFKHLQGQIPDIPTVTPIFFKIYQYEILSESKTIKYFLDERRMGVLTYDVVKDKF